jgi:hypothetical protein
MRKRYNLTWKHSRLNIGCWECSEILVTIATDRTSLSFSSITELLELCCPTCRIACEYSLIDKDDGLFEAYALEL